MKKFLSLVLALVMTMSLVTISAGAKDFTDAETVTYTEAVDVLSAVKVIDGYTDGAFKPTTPLNRGQAAKILCNLILGPTTASALKADAAPFKDVAADSTFAAYIAYCAKEGIIDGYTDGTFRPAAPLTGYAFMKLLLGALGYDKDIEGYNGANWSINVAKRALNIGLDDGLVDDFNGVKPVTREEACLFALNTMKATMVEYGSKTSVNVGGAEVVIAGSTAKAVENNGKTDGYIDRDGNMQFAEKYFTSLKMYDNVTDDFARPATEWVIKNDSVGVYTDTPDAVYDSDVKTSKIYSALGLDKQIDAVLYVDGKLQTNAVPVGRAFDNKLNDSVDSTAPATVVGDGSQVEVFYDRDAGTIKLVSITTYVGTILATKAATNVRDAYVVIGTKTNPDDATLGRPVAASTLQFETDDTYEIDDVVLYTYANGKVQTVAKAEKVEGTLNTIYKDNKIDVAGTKYSYSAHHAFNGKASGTQSLDVKSSYVVYLDKSGNAIDVVLSEFVAADYAFVEALHAGDSWYHGNQAKLVYLDGTTGKVDTDVAYSSDFEDNYYLVTHRTNSDKETVLKKVDGTKYYNATTSANFYMKTNDSAVILNDADSNGLYTPGETALYANSKTVVVVKDITNNKYHAYTGVKNMPTIMSDGSNELWISYYCKEGNILSYAFIMAPATLIKNSSDSITFLAGKSLSKHTTDTDVIDYYTYNAVVNGEITTVRVAASLVSGKSNVIYDTSYINNDGIVTYTNYTSTNTTGNGTGLIRVSDEVVGFKKSGTTQYYTLSSDLAVYSISDGGDIEKVTENYVITDDALGYTYVLNSSNEVRWLFIQDYSDETTGSPIGSSATYTVTASNVSGALKVAVASSSDHAGETVTVDKVVITNLTNNNSVSVPGGFASTQTLNASGDLSAVQVTGISITPNGLTTYTVYLKIGNEIVASNILFA